MTNLTRDPQTAYRNPQSSPLDSKRGKFPIFKILAAAFLINLIALGCLATFEWRRWLAEQRGKVNGFIATEQGKGGFLP